MIDIYLGFDYELEHDIHLDNDNWFDVHVFGYNKFLTQKLRDILYRIDKVRFTDGWNIKSPITGEYISMESASTGCKTAINCLCFPNEIFSAIDCGENALREIYKLPNAKIYFRTCVPMLPFDDLKGNFVLHIDGEQENFTYYDDLIRRVEKWLSY